MRRWGQEDQRGGGNRRVREEVGTGGSEKRWGQEGQRGGGDRRVREEVGTGRVREEVGTGRVSRSKGRNNRTHTMSRESTTCPYVISSQTSALVCVNSVPSLAQCIAHVRNSSRHGTPMPHP